MPWSMFTQTRVFGIYKVKLKVFRLNKKLRSNLFFLKSEIKMLEQDIQMYFKSLNILGVYLIKNKIKLSQKNILNYLLSTSQKSFVLKKHNNALHFQMKAIKILLKKNCQGEYAKQLFFLVYILHKHIYSRYIFICIFQRWIEP